MRRVLPLKPILLLILFLLIASLAGIYAWYAVGQKTPPVVLSEAEEQFLAKHWQQPLALQGPVPVSFSPLEASLDPASCGTCHRTLLSHLCYSEGVCPWLSIPLYYLRKDYSSYRTIMFGMVQMMVLMEHRRGLRKGGVET